MRGVRGSETEGPTTSVGARGEMGARGARQGVPTTSVGARGKMGARGSEGSERE